MTEFPDATTAAAVVDLRAGLRIMALVRLKDAEAAEEAAQEALSRVLTALREDRVADRSRLGAFAGGVALHVIADIQRARARMLTLDESAPGLTASDPDPLSLLVSGEEAGRVRSALAALSPADQELLRLSFYEDLTPATLSARLGEPPTRIRKRKQRALERLRRAFLGDTGHAGAAPATDEERDEWSASREGRE